MANPEHLAILKQGVERWNKWREEHPDVEPDLSETSLHLGELGRNGADLRGGNFRGANLTGIQLQEHKHWNASLYQADLTEAHLRRAQLGGADLRNANLAGAILEDANLAWATLTGANLTKAFLQRANLAHATLDDADLSLAILDSANLAETDLSGADLGEAHLVRANLTGAELTGADFSGAQIIGTGFSAIDLSPARGLETIKHYGPSTIGIDTIYKSRGKIPEVFLRGCGVPEEFIAYIGSMVRRPIEFYSCFISYSTKDQQFADRLYIDLQNKGVRCWFAPHDITGGRKLHEQIDEAIRMHDKLLLIISENSMSSEWVGTEIANARERERREKKQMLFPITMVPFEEVKKWKLFDADRGKDSAREVREYFIPDFSNWKDHESYQAAFQRLIQDLKAGAAQV